MKQKYRKLGDLIQPVDERNKSLVTTDVQGISIDKEFMPSVANTIGTDLSNYKLLRKNRFACNPMHVGRDERLPVSLYEKDKPAIVSPAYFMFELKNESEVLPSFLMLLFKRDNFDRNCYFRTDGSVRGGIAWNDLCELELPVPDLAEQQRIVASYNTVDRRIRLLKQINEKLEDAAQTIYRKMFIEDADEKWEVKKLGEIADLSAGGDKPECFSESKTELCSVPIYSNGIDNYGLYGFTDKPKITKEAVTVSARGTIGYPCLRLEPYFPIIRLVSVIPRAELTDAVYLYFFLKNANIVSSGTTQQQLTVPEFSETKVVVPPLKLIEQFSAKARKLFLATKKNEAEIAQLQNLRQLLISRISGM